MADTHTDWLTASSEHPQIRQRFNVARNSSGITFESTTEVTWTGTASTYYTDGEERSIDALLDELRDRERDEITSRVHEARNVDTYVPKPSKAA